MCIEDSQRATESVPTSGAAISTFSATSQGHYITDLSTPQSAPFLEHPPTFLHAIVFPLVFVLNTETAKVRFQKFLSRLARFPGLCASIGDFSALVFPTVGHTVPWTAPSPLPSVPHDFWPAPILLK